MKLPNVYLKLISNLAQLFSVAVGLLISLSVSAAPVAITVPNGDFESPVLNSSNIWSSPIPSWANSSPAPGVVYPNATLPPVSQGYQYAYCDLDFFNLSQNLSSPTIESNALYELYVDLWRLNTTNTSVVLQLNDITAGVVLGERLYHPTYNTNLEQFVFTTNAWSTVRVSFHSADFPGIAGHTLNVTLQGAHLLLDNVRLYKTTMIPASAGNYYVSASGGSDANDGLSSATAWQTFAPLNERTFAAGSMIWLKRGDVWNSELNLRGSGSAAATNQLGAYGTGGRPLIIRSDRDFDRCIVLNNASHWRVSGLECRNAALGVFIRCFQSLTNRNITVQDCFFANMDSWRIDPQLHSMEWAVPAGIWVGGIVKNSDTNANVFDGLTVNNCGMDNCTAGIGSGFYFPSAYSRRITNVKITNGYATRVTIGGLSFDSASQGVIQHFRTFQLCGKTGAFGGGTTGVMLSSCTNFVFQDCEFSDTDRIWPDQTQGDGSGFDFERSDRWVTLQRCVMHDNEGEAVLTLATTASGVANSNLFFNGCTFWNNALDPADATYSPGGNTFEIKFTTGTAQGTVTNCGLYRMTNSTSTNFYYPATLPGSIKLTNNRTNKWLAVLTRDQTPAWNWNTNGNFESWTNRNQWASPTVSGGTYSGTASGNDPYVYSPLIWVNTLRATPFIRVRMKSTAGNGAIYFSTEADPVFDGVKVVGFPVIADNAFHDYTVDMRASTGYGGVVTQIRLDPSDVSGAQFAIDSINWQPNLSAASVQILSTGGYGIGPRLSFATDPGITIRIQSSTNMTTWNSVGTNTTDAYGYMEFIDGTNAAPAGTYRMVWP